jgi:hypothetical protein
MIRPNDTLRAEGERLRDIGMALAAGRRPDRVTLGRLAMVKALLLSPTSTATIDDATTTEELASGYADGGRWRGTVTRSLLLDGFAIIDGMTRSKRPSRHRGYVAILRLTDRQAAIAYLSRMTAAIAAFNETTPPVAADGVSMTDTSKTTDQGDLTNDQPI